MDMTQIIEKLKDILSEEIGQRRVFDKDVANALGISKESLSTYKKKNSIPYEPIVTFCAKRSISINWVLFNQHPKSLEEHTDKYARIKHFTNINASAGGGGFNYDEHFGYLCIDKEILDTLYRSRHANNSNIFALNVIGDSMEPTLNDREIILCDKGDTDIFKGGVYIISTNAGLFVKRLALKANGDLELISDNKNYNSEIIPSSMVGSVKIMGKVLGKVALVA